MKESRKPERCAVLLLAVLSVLIKRTLPCSGPNCGSCVSDPYCDQCDPNDGTFGFNTAHIGCDDCYSVSGGSCSLCADVSHCDACTNSNEGPVAATTTASCSACDPNCDYCQNAGAGFCDPASCKAGYDNDLCAGTTCVLM